MICCIGLSRPNDYVIKGDGEEKVQKKLTKPQTHQQLVLSCFSLFIHELIKGVYEVLKGLPDDPKAADGYGSDRYTLRSMGSRLGPVIWRCLLRLILKDYIKMILEIQNYLLKIFKCLLRILRSMRMILPGSDEGKQLFQRWLMRLLMNKSYDYEMDVTV